MKKALVEVCRAWNCAAIEFLYEFVAFRRLGQVPALLRTLHAAPDLGNLIKRIFIFIPLFRRHRHTLTHGVSSVVSQSPRLEVFSFTNHSGEISLFEDILGQMLFPNTLARLELSSCEMNNPQIVRMLNSCQNLVHFTIFSYGDPSLSNISTITCERVALNRLENLQVHVIYSPTLLQSTSAEYLLRTITSQWDLPRLRCLTVGIESLPRQINRLEDLFGGLLRVHGKSLLKLSIRTPLVGSGTPATNSMPLLISHCPVLEYLIFVEDHCPFSDGWGGHPTLKWIDLWSQKETPTLQIGLTQLTGFPKLQGIRLLNLALAEICDLPFAFPPIMAQDGPGIEIFRLPGVDVEVTRDYIWAKELVHYESDTDSEYIQPDSDNESYCSEEWVDEDYVWSLEMDDEPEVEIDSDEVLEIFTRMLSDDD